MTVTRAAFYYPWFPETEQWRSHYVPQLGRYDSSDPAVIAQHIAWARYARLDAFIASYWGAGSKTAARLPLLLDEANRQAFKIAPYYELTSIGVSEAGLRADMDALASWTPHPGWLRADGKPVLFVYNTGAWADGSAVARLIAAAAGKFYLNLKVFGGYRTVPQPDSWHQYGPAVPYDQQGLHSVTVSPGFWKFDEPKPRLDRSLIRFHTDLDRMTKSGARWQLITSWNEWGEGTGVENTYHFGPTWLDTIRTALGAA
jgi:hypothetical protein